MSPQGGSGGGGHAAHPAWRVYRRWNGRRTHSLEQARLLNECGWWCASPRKSAVAPKARNLEVVIIGGTIKHRNISDISSLLPSAGCTQRGRVCEWRFQCLCNPLGNVAPVCALPALLLRPRLNGPHSGWQRQRQVRCPTTVCVQCPVLVCPVDRCPWVGTTGSAAAGTAAHVHDGGRLMTQGSHPPCHPPRLRPPAPRGDGPVFHQRRHTNARRTRRGGPLRQQQCTCRQRCISAGR